MSDVPAQTPLATAWQQARSFQERGDPAGAKIVLEHAIEAGGAAYGPSHPDVLETARILADLHRQTGDLAAARRTLEAALAAGQLTLPEHHPAMLLLAYDLGIVAGQFGNRHEARRNLATVARLGPAALGDDHAAVLAAGGYLNGELPTPRPPTEERPASPIAQLVRPASSYPDQPSTTPARRRRTPLLVGAVVAAVTVVTAGTTPALVSKTRPSSDASTTPTTGTNSTATNQKTVGPGPTEVRLRDQGASITLTWRDPSPGTVPFIVAGGRAGEQARTFANLPAGRTSYTLNGLNPRLEYCFTVVAIYSTESFSASDLVCTRRSSRYPQSTRS